MFIFVFIFERLQIEIYEDKDNARKDEIAALGGQTATGINVFSAFYDRLKEVTVYFVFNLETKMLTWNFVLILLFS